MVTLSFIGDRPQQPSPGVNVYKKLVPKMVLYQLLRNSLNIYGYLQHYVGFENDEISIFSY